MTNEHAEHLVTGPHPWALTRRRPCLLRGYQVGNPQMVTVWYLLATGWASAHGLPPIQHRITPFSRFTA